MTNKFKSAFKDFACDGDKITAHITFREKIYDVTATLHRDDDTTRPDQRQDGYWPSLDPQSAGYIGDKTQKELDEQTRHANYVMNAWKKDKWFYCGIVLSVELDDTMIDKHAESLWGIECNYPHSEKQENANEYLTTVANELLEEWLHKITEQFKQTGESPKA